MKSLLIKLWMYVKHPIGISMDFHRLINSGRFKKLRLKSLPPNYIYLDHFDENSVIVDVGSGSQAEFSTTMIERYGVRSFLVDPTLKHAPALKELEIKYAPQIRHLPYALSGINGETTFYESRENESGSLLKTHTNILHDTVREYKVQMVDLNKLLTFIPNSTIDFLKIDIEGAEYNLFSENNLQALSQVKQLFVEFHHMAFKDFKKKDTLKVVRQIEATGLQSFSWDGINYLFYRG
jgi:FkbM family methyltransferase